MSLDQRVAEATEELLETTRPDVPSWLADLRRTRRRRSLARTGVVAAVLALVVGGWALVRHERAAPQPAEPGVRNGALVGRNVHSLVVVSGELAHRPRDNASFTNVQFTADGSELVYVRRGLWVTAMDVDTGETRDLARCPSPTTCTAALSPDGGTVALLGDEDTMVLQDLATGRQRPYLQVRGLGYQWSPDGRTIAYDGDGLSTVDVATGRTRLLHPYRDGQGVVLPPSWSPDGTRLAFFDRRLVGGTSEGKYRFTAMIVDADGGTPRTLAEAGACVCLGLAPPALAWSPDGKWIAVSSVGGGVSLLSPDGSRATRGIGDVVQGDLAWQPLPR